MGRLKDRFRDLGDWWWVAIVVTVVVLFFVGAILLRNSCDLSDDRLPWCNSILSGG